MLTQRPYLLKGEPQNPLWKSKKLQSQLGEIRNGTFWKFHRLLQKNVCNSRKHDVIFRKVGNFSGT